VHGSALAARRFSFGAVMALAVAGALSLAASAAQASFPGKPGLIVYEADAGGDSDIFSAPLGAATGTNLTNTAGVTEVYPGVSADGTRVVYTRLGNIWAMNIDGSGQTQLTNFGNDNYASFSPDGARIVFTRAGDVWVMNSDGSGPQQLVNTPETDYDPVFSPDGATIAFGDGDPTRLSLMNADGSNRRSLESGHTGENDYYPNYSPDGRKILFSSDGALFEFDVATSGFAPALVTDAVRMPFNPVYAPDGSGIVAASDASDTLLSYSPAGALLGSFATGGDNPDWQPIPVKCGGKTATIVGTNAGEALTGTPAADVIAALGGKDNVKGLAGNDFLCGGKGKDKVSGGAGKDSLYGEAGNDQLNGGKGKDKLLGAKGRDSCGGGGGADSGKGCEREKSL
jgi:Tol biopolymer transport system component